METYLIPANTKKSMLIFGMFNKTDLIIFIVGVLLSFVLLLTLDVSKLMLAIIALLPALTCGFLVFPIPNYHNMRTLITSIYKFYLNPRNYGWKGWCASDDETK